MRRDSNRKPSAGKRQSRSDLLFEIGTEELPASYLPGLIDDIRERAAGLLQGSCLDYEAITSYGTPRRLVLMVRGLVGYQRIKTSEIRGPSKHVAYDNRGRPTKALLGFLRSNNGLLKDTKLVASDKAEHVYLVKPPRRVATTKVLEGLLPGLVSCVRSPKTMRWDNSGARFARPIRWILALYGSKALRCAVGAVRSGVKTWIGAPKNPKAIKVSSITHYLGVMKRAGIILDHAARRGAIQSLVADLSQRLNGTPAPETASHGLLDEVVFLVEAPIPLTGVFDKRYLALPREVLLASMAKYQRLFALEDKHKRIIARFVGILDGRPGDIKTVGAGYERILNARLSDSLLFLKMDRERLPLTKMSQGLSEVVFHRHLGSMSDKAKRLRSLAGPLAEAWRLSSEEQGHLERACELAKADLVSSMVREFPTLQGVVGRLYARESGEAKAVCAALEEQYLPLGGRRPATLIGSALAIADKYDTLSSYFSLGIEPTGDEDPFGLRRAAQGIVEIAWGVHRPLPLDVLLQVRARFAPFVKGQHADLAKLGGRVRAYLFERLYSFSWNSAKDKRHNRPAPDMIEAVLSSQGEDLVDAMERASCLQRLKDNPKLLKAAKVIERTHNILRGACLRKGEVDPARFQDPLEHRLWSAYKSGERQVVALIKEKAYDKATIIFGEVFFDILHDFFEKVMVNVPEEALQQNRLALMKTINALYTDRVADLSKLSILERKVT